MGKNEQILILSNFITSFGNSMTQIVLMLLVFNITNTPMAVSILLLINMLLTILINPIVFRFIDKLNKKNVLIICEFFSAGLLLILVQHTHQLILIYAYIALRSIIKGFSVPSFRSIIPQITDKKNLVKFNSYMSLSNGLVSLLGTAFGGIIVAYMGYRTALMIDLTTFLLSAMILKLIDFSTVKSSTKNPDSKTSLSSSYISFLKSHAELLPLFLMITLFWLNAGVISALRVPYYERIANFNDASIGILYSIDSAGVIVFSYIISRIGRDKVISYYLYGILLGSIMPMLLTFYTSFIYIVCISFLIDWGSIINNICVDSRIQTNYSSLEQGRIFGLIHVFNHVGMSLGVLGAGVLAEKIGVIPALRSSLIITLIIIGVRVFGKRYYSAIFGNNKRYHSYSP